MLHNSCVQSSLRCDLYRLVPPGLDAFHGSCAFALMHSNPFRAAPCQYGMFLGSIVQEAMAAPLIWTGHIIDPVAPVHVAPVELTAASSLQPPSQAGFKADSSNDLLIPDVFHPNAMTLAALSPVSASPVNISASDVTVTTTGTHVALPSAAATSLKSNAAVATPPPPLHPSAPSQATPLHLLAYRSSRPSPIPTLIQHQQ